MFTAPGAESETAEGGSQTSDLTQGEQDRSRSYAPSPALAILAWQPV